MDIPKADRRVATPADAAKTSATFAHEINNSIDSLLALLYLVENEGTLAEKGRHYLSLARDELRRISQAAREVLNREPASAVPERANVVAMVGGILDFYESHLRSRGITVRTRYCSRGDATVYAGQLRHALSNLLLNAADAASAGQTIHVRISRAHEWSGKRRRGLRITIADSGSGISSENLPHIFEPFFTTKGRRGTGMGLSLARDVVRRHRGLLRVRSSTKPDHHGTVFTVFLPARVNGSPWALAA